MESNNYISAKTISADKVKEKSKAGAIVKTYIKEENTELNDVLSDIENDNEFNNQSVILNN